MTAGRWLEACPGSEWWFGLAVFSVVAGITTASHSQCLVPDPVTPGKYAAGPCETTEPAPTEVPAEAKRADPDPSAAAEGRTWSAGESPMTIELSRGTTLVMGPNSQVVWQPMLPVPLGIKDAAPRVFALQLLRGSIDVEIAKDKRPIHGVLVHAPQKIGAIIKVGRATVRTTAAATTVVASAGQDLSVSVAERWRTLRVGRSFSVSSQGPAGIQRQIPSAPAIRLDRPLALVVNATRRTRQHLRWQPVAGAEGYQVRLRLATARGLTVVQEKRVAVPEIWFEDLMPGRYEAEVASLDAVGVESTPSAPARLRVVEVRLPAGAYLDGEVIHLPNTERVSLLHATDLEMTYGAGSTPFIAVPETVGLHDGHAVRIRLREPGSNQEMLLRLEPLDITPHIAIEPIRAQWPGPPLNILVSIRRGNGTAIANTKDFVATVTVNAQPVKVDWQHGASTWKAQLDKPPFPGPWVVRVVVEDARGHVFGRDFLEVAVAPRDETTKASLEQFQ